MDLKPSNALQLTARYLASNDKEGWCRLPARGLWALGADALISSVGEGAMADWSAASLAEVIGPPEGTAALAFAAYSGAMTVARLSGDHLQARLSPATIMRADAWVAGISLLLVVTSLHVPFTLLGFAVIGLGLANVIPIAFSAAGNFPGIPSGVGIAAVATIGYVGFLASPPLIGFLAEATSLTIAFAWIIILLAVLPLIAHTVSTGKPAKQSL